MLLSIAILFQAALIAAPAPDFTVTTSDGQVRKLYQDYVNQQKLVVLEIFFTTCPPCATHAPLVQTLYQNMTAAYPGQVEFILLSDKSADNNAAVAAYLTSKGLTMPAAGSDGSSLTAVQPYKSGSFGTFLGTPTFVVIAPGTGEVFFDIRGVSPQETMTLISQKINDLLPQVQNCFLKSYFENPVPEVQITVNAPAFDSTFTASGEYSVSDISQLQNTTYTITPFKGDEPLQGLSTWDLVTISKHILGIAPFTENWQSLAADMNCSGSVTTFDIVEGRKLILGINDAFSGCGGATWRFVAEPDGPTSNGGCLNFRGVKIGDLTGYYFAPDDPVDDRDRDRLFCENRRLERGRTYRVPVRTSADFQLAGFQLSFGLQPEALRIHRIESPVLEDFSRDHYNLELQRAEGYVPASWTSGARPAELRAGETLLVLEVEALQNVLLSDVLGLRQQLRAEDYDEDGEIRPLELEWRDAPTISPGTIFLSPNPAREVVFVDFNAEHGQETLVQIMDVQGKIVFEKTIAVAEGANRAELRPDVPLAGWHFVKINGQAAGRVFFEKRR